MLDAGYWILVTVICPWSFVRWSGEFETHHSKATDNGPWTTNQKQMLDAG